MRATGLLALREALEDLEQGPAAFVAGVLDHHREAGESFVTAWTRAMHALPRGAAPAVVEQRREWIEALRWAKPAFRAAFEGGQAPTVTHLEVTHLEDIAAVLGGAGRHDGDLPQSATTRLEDAAVLAAA